jgi:hypothetical protein
MRAARPPHSGQTWATFLHNHAHDGPQPPSVTRVAHAAGRQSARARPRRACRPP